MLKKSYSKTGKSCRVTFKTDVLTDTDQVALLGDFNAWDPKTHCLKARKDGSFSLTLSLDAGQDYRFRYLMDGSTWTNEAEADQLVPNQFGTSDSLITV